MPGAGATNYTYNADRQLTGIARPDGATLNYSYDSSGRLSSLAIPTATINYNYDSATGHRTSAVIPGGEEVDWTYLGFLKASENWKGQVTGSVVKTFDTNFWTASETLRDGGTPVKFAYDNDGLVTTDGAMTITRSASRPGHRNQIGRRNRYLDL